MKLKGCLLGTVILLAFLVLVAEPNRIRQEFVTEVAAQKIVQCLHTVQAQYRSQYGRFACFLTELGPPSHGAPSALGADLIDGDFAKGERRGYRYRLTCTPDGYTVEASPLSRVGHFATFSSDQTTIIRKNWLPLTQWKP